MHRVKRLTHTISILTSCPRIRPRLCWSQQQRLLLTQSSDVSQMQPLESLNLSELIEKTEIQKSAVIGLFVGQVDKHCLSFPEVVVEKHETDHIAAQKKMVEQHFTRMFVQSFEEGDQELERFGFHDLKSLSATEAVSIFEGIGNSHLPEHNDLTIASPYHVCHSSHYHNQIMRLIHQNWPISQDDNPESETNRVMGQVAISAFLFGRFKWWYDYTLKLSDSEMTIVATQQKNCVRLYHLFEMVRELYKMEACVYYTAGLLDSFEGRDLTPDATVLKLTSLTSCHYMLKHMVHMLKNSQFPIGTEYDRVSWYSEQIGSCFTSKMLLGVRGLQEYASQHPHDIQKFRSDPKQGSKVSKPEKLGIDSYFNVNFSRITPRLEQMLAQLQLNSQVAYRKAIDNKEETALSLAEQAISIVQIIICLARGTRALTGALENFDADLVIAEHAALVETMRHKAGYYVDRQEVMQELVIESGYYPPTALLFARERRPAVARTRRQLEPPVSEFPVDKGLDNISIKEN